MNAEALDYWERAQDSLRAARLCLPVSSDTAASRAYYAAFYAVSAWLACCGRSFTKHAAVAAAVHRDLVNAGLWSRELGEGYSRLLRRREIGDYGGGRHVAAEEAEESVRWAEQILQAVAQLAPNEFKKFEK